MASLRRFSSEGSLLDLDSFPWRKTELTRAGKDKRRESGTTSLDVAQVERDGEQRPMVQEPSTKRGLVKEVSVSVEDLRELDKKSKSHLDVCGFGEGYRAYSDGQLAPAAKGSTESVERDELASPSASLFSRPFSPKSQHRHQHKAKLSAAKLHLKNLFGQSPHSSNSNLSNTEPKDSAKERRSRLLFMRQWSQVGHNRRHALSREELEKWGESLDYLLASPTGLSVFGAFLRSEFSEENLQFYLAFVLLQVNIDSKTRDLTIRLLQAPSRTSLSLAQKRIYSLLDTDCYHRFIQSDIYLSLLREAD